MALYIPAGRRRRRLAIIVAVTAVVSVLIGVGIGRVTAPTAADGARQAKEVVTQVTGQLAALPIHYEQAAKGETDKAAFQASLVAALDRVDTDLEVALGDAAWMDDAAKNGVRQKVAAVRAASSSGADPAAFQAAVDDAVTTLETMFGERAPA